MNEPLIYLKQSALKHHISAKDIKWAIANLQHDEVMEGDEEKRLLLGFDTR